MDAALPVNALDAPEAGARAIRGAALRGGAFVVGGLLAAVSAPLLFRHLGVADFGRYSTVIALVGLVAGLTEGGIGAVGTREYAVLADAQRDRLMRNLLGLRVVLTSAGCLSAITFAVVAAYGSELVVGTAVASSALLLGVVQATYAVPLYATLVIGRQVAAELVRQVVMVVLTVMLVLLGAGLVPLLAVPIPAVLGLLAYTVLVVRGRMPLTPAFELGFWRGLLRDTAPVAVAGAAHTVYFRCVILVMSLVAPALQTGLFATSYRVMEVLSGFPALVVGTVYPILARAAHDDRERLTYGLGRVLEVAVIGGVWAACCTALAAEPIMAVIGGRAAAPAVPVLRLQAIALVQAFTGSAVGFALLSLRRHRELLLASLAALVATVAATFALVPALGARGGALATVLGELVLGTALVVYLMRAAPELRLPWNTVRKVALAGLAGGALTLVPGPSDVVRTVLFSVAYFAVLLAVRAIPTEIRAALVERFRGSRFSAAGGGTS